MTLPLSCKLLADIKYTCCGSPSIRFRAYLGHLNGKEVSVAIRHITEGEAKKGISFLTSRFWVLMTIKEERFNSNFQVLVNIGSIRKRLLAAGGFAEIIDFCIAHKNFTVLKLVFQDRVSLPFASRGVFISHGPFI
jgi:hypothetical protein